ncbi:uncharacterized protein LOC133871563 [Alnus glutinosa]|uniref:uncharacterized protein LOC133871563 n=1 Tax=Alnus glutinosa TaxID=3517 RepID=UPI002D7906EE|nr:uncharacterized protein LOC133871563 [Alnus glutinosa]
MAPRRNGNYGNHRHSNRDNEFPPPPPPFNDGVSSALAQFMAETTRQFAEVVARIPQPAGREAQVGCSMRDFASQQFRLFDGMQEPLAVEAWISDITLLHETLGCTEEQKVNYTILRFTDEASKWWKSKKGLLGIELGHGVAIPWDRFVEEFNGRFFPRAQRQIRAIEFQNLVQGTMTVEQYSAKFIELSRFGLNIIPDEETKSERFENGLNPRIKERVMCHEIRNFVKLVDIATIAERGMRESSAAYELKRRAASQVSYPFKRPALSTASRPAEKRNFPPTTGNQVPLCQRCGKVHAGECKASEPNCFKCGQRGHFRRNCPLDAPEGSRLPRNNVPPRQLTQARVYTLTPVEEDEEEERGVNDVVTGKANVVADALSRKSLGVSTNSTPTPNQLAKQLGMIQLDVAPSVKDAILAALIIRPLTADRIKIAQENDLGLQQLMEKTSQGKASGFYFTEDDLLRTGDARAVIPNDA